MSASRHKVLAFVNSYEGESDNLSFASLGSARMNKRALAAIVNFVNLSCGEPEQFQCDSGNRGAGARGKQC